MAKLVDDKTWRWNPRVATRSFEGTAFVLMAGRMVSLNEVGTRVWELCKDGATIDSVAAHICEEFEVSEEVATRDVQAFVELLAGKELLIASRLVEP